ncbi:hypothetical protein ACFLZN_00840, partial [Nanoarchaeota archaeon]
MKDLLSKLKKKISPFYCKGIYTASIIVTVGKLPKSYSEKKLSSQIKKIVEKTGLYQTVGVGLGYSVKPTKNNLKEFEKTVKEFPKKTKNFDALFEKEKGIFKYFEIGLIHSKFYVKKKNAKHETIDKIRKEVVSEINEFLNNKKIVTKGIQVQVTEF